MRTYHIYTIVFLKSTLAKKYISEKSLEEALAMLHFGNTTYDIKLQSIKAIFGKQSKLIKGVIEIAEMPKEIHIGAKTKITIITDPITICLEMYIQLL